MNLMMATQEATKDKQRKTPGEASDSRLIGNRPVS